MIAPIPQNQLSNEGPNVSLSQCCFLEGDVLLFHQFGMVVLLLVAIHTFLSFQYY